jgi:hypothetical protein
LKAASLTSGLAASLYLVLAKSGVRAASIHFFDAFMNYAPSITKLLHPKLQPVAIYAASALTLCCWTLFIR